MALSIFLVILMIKLCFGFSDVGKWDLPLSGTWRDLRRKARTEGSVARRAANATGNATEVPILTDETKKILGIMGTEGAFGIQGGEESGIGTIPAALSGLPAPVLTQEYEFGEETAQSPSQPSEQEQEQQSTPQPRLPQLNQRRSSQQRQRRRHDPRARANQFLEAELQNNNILRDSCTFGLAKSLFKGSKLYIVLHCGEEESMVTLTYEWLPAECSPDYFHYYDQQFVKCTPPSNGPREVNSTDSRNKYHCHSRISYNVMDDTGVAGGKGQVADGNKFDQPLLTVPTEGVYQLKVWAHANGPLNVTVEVRLPSPHGYLSAAMWPLLVFFGTMCVLYTLLCTLWLAVCAAQWRDLLRIQYWIGAVAMLGMLETATFYGCYAAVNNTGYFSLWLYMLAEWVSVGKRALARMLVIIVSLGFGIVKPRLGPVLQRVVAAGSLWLALGCVNSWLRLRPHSASPRTLLLSEAPLSLLDSAICWWVFVSLAHTMRTLQLRRNTIKLSLYKHFTNTLIFAVISSVIFMLYSIKSYRVLDCITDWKEVWMDEAYWHMLFIAVLSAIMVLWRPTNNNQRYAFTPLLDNEDDDEEDQFVNDAYGVKMRGASVNESKDDIEVSPHTTSLDSDLRWVEENIPASTLPLLDSDEEIINTKFEVSKMQ